MNDQSHDYLYFASRFYEMPILVLDQKRREQTQEQLLQLFSMRRALLTSLDSPFNIMKKYPGLWSKHEMAYGASMRRKCYQLGSIILIFWIFGRLMVESIMAN